MSEQTEKGSPELPLPGSASAGPLRQRCRVSENETTEPVKYKAYPYMRFWVGDWFRSYAVRIMTTEQLGAYVNLLLHAWPTSESDLDDPCTLPDDDVKLAALAGVKPERWAEIGAFVREQFERIGNGRIRHARQWREYIEQIKSSAGKSASGKTGMANRWAGAYPEEFERTWRVYPERVAGNPKKPAFEKWQARVNEGATPDELHAAVVRYAAYIKAKGDTGSDFVLMMQTFFGPNERWKEPYAIAAPRQRGGAIDYANARERWTFYNNMQLTSWATVEPRLGQLNAELRAELEKVKPWVIARTARDAQAAIAEVARRLAA